MLNLRLLTPGGSGLRHRTNQGLQDGLRTLDELAVNLLDQVAQNHLIL